MLQLQEQLLIDQFKQQPIGPDSVLGLNGRGEISEPLPAAESITFSNSLVTWFQCWKYVTKW